MSISNFALTIAKIANVCYNQKRGGVMSKLYDYFEHTNVKPSNENFHLHLHDEYEIFMFLEGDAKYVVEGNVYDLEPYDVIVIKKYQMHKVFHNSPARYRRTVLTVSPEFFKEYNCPEYEESFITLSDNTGNKISADIVKKSGMYDAIMRLKKYSDNFCDHTSPITRACITEILYIINGLKNHSVQASTIPHLKEIITYINNNFTKKITLNMLEDKFYISKYHLCHIFPQATGLTVHQYISKKRLALAKELIDAGNTMNESAIYAGFNNYSSFYRAFVSEYGHSPKNK